MSASRLVFLGSTGGGVLSRLGAHDCVRRLTAEAVSDRDCGFLRVAASFGMPTARLDAADGSAFSDALAERFRGRDELIFISFYTRLLGGAFLAEHEGRIVNCHPSILPSFKGMHGFEDTLASSATFMGSTVHLVDAGIDSGRILMQAAIPLDRRLPLAENRHKVFLSQYYAVLQLVRWVDEGRLALVADGGLAISGARHASAVFSPNLDADFFAFAGVPDELG
jgi:phosphoribosylglycinamide formyltransferase-1